MDWAKRLGEKIGGEWLALVTNSLGQVIKACRTRTTKLDELIPALEALSRRPAFKPQVLVIDNVPPGVETSKYVERLMETLLVKKVMQDRFHVAHSFSQHFNNMHPFYYSLIIHGFRCAYTVYDAQKEATLDALLLDGQVAKNVTFRGEKIHIQRGTATRQEDIDAWKESGAYEHLFGSSGRCVVPRLMKNAVAIEHGIADLVAKVLDQVLNEDGSQKRVEGKVLITDAATEVPRIFENARKRLVNCIPPPGLPEYVETGKVDSCTGMQIVTMEFHTSHNKNNNGQTLDMITADNMESSLGIGILGEGFEKLNENRDRDHDISKNKGHYKPWLRRRANAAAGFDDAENHGDRQPGVRLQLSRPHDEDTPPRAASDDFVIENIGRFGKRVHRRALVQPAVTAKLLTDREGAENFRPMLTSEIKTKLAMRISVTQRLSLTTTDPSPTSITAAARAPSPDPSTRGPPPPDDLSATSVTAAARGPPPPEHLSAISSVGAPSAGGRNPLTMLRRTAGPTTESGKIADRQEERKNLWLCTCLPDYRLKSAGRKRHDAACPRGRWSTDNSLEKTPPVSTKLTMRASAAPLRGLWQWNGSIGSVNRGPLGRPPSLPKAPELKEKKSGLYDEDRSKQAKKASQRQRPRSMPV